MGYLVVETRRSGGSNEGVVYGWDCPWLWYSIGEMRSE